MREIKFRYTCVRSDGHTFSRIFTLEQIESCEVRQWWELNHIGKDTLHKDQYTGLKDKNGKEIYEGDIVRHFDKFPSEQNLQVIWQEHGFYYAWSDGLINHKLMSTEFFEVIGNICENKELLK